MNFTGIYLYVCALFKSSTRNLEESIESTFPYTDPIPPFTSSTPSPSPACPVPTPSKCGSSCSEDEDEDAVDIEPSAELDDLFMAAQAQKSVLPDVTGAVDDELEASESSWTSDSGNSACSFSAHVE